MRLVFRIFFTLGIFLLGLGANAQSAIRYYNTSLCNSWTYLSATTGPSGFACSFYPTMAQVPDAQSTQAVISQLEARIQALEAKIQNPEVKRERH